MVATTPANSPRAIYSASCKRLFSSLTGFTGASETSSRSVIQKNFKNQNQHQTFSRFPRVESETSLRWLFWVVSYADSSLALDDLYCVFKKNASGNTDVSHCGTN